MIDTTINNTRVIVYDPNIIPNIPKMFNEILQDEDETNLVMFVFEDLWNAAKSQDELVTRYSKFIEEYEMPYALYPYYKDFNRMHLNEVHKPFPKAEIILVNSDIKCNLLAALSVGLLIVDKAKLKSINFTFNEDYPLFFYEFDLLLKCALNHLTPSFNFYIDIDESWKLFNDFEVKYDMNLTNIGKEKSSYMEKVLNKTQGDTSIHDVNEVINRIKKQQEKIYGSSR